MYEAHFEPSFKHSTGTEPMALYKKKNDETSCMYIELTSAGKSLPLTLKQDGLSRTKIFPHPKSR